MAQEITPPTHDTEATDDGSGSPPCVLTFNANDPSGAGGISGDVLSCASVGAHALSVVTGTYMRDTAEIFDHIAFDEEAVAEQARSVLEDLSVQVIKVGFCGNPENLSVIAEIATDYADVPVVAYMPNLSWWEDAQIDAYLDAFRELILPQTTVLVGNHSTLCRWLMPDWDSDKTPGPREVARAAAGHGVPYTLVTGFVAADQYLETHLASPETVMATARYERFDATFNGAGDTLSAALTALIAGGTDLQNACAEAMTYLDQCLDAGYQPGMGHAVPDRLFWAHDDDEEADAADNGDMGPDFPLDTTRH